MRKNIVKKKSAVHRKSGPTRKTRKGESAATGEAHPHAMAKSVGGEVVAREAVVPGAALEARSGVGESATNNSRKEDKDRETVDAMQIGDGETASTTSRKEDNERETENAMKAG
eukprot:Nk52_evm1s515 gene=Nk52_evmTU1s515